MLKRPIALSLLALGLSACGPPDPTSPLDTTGLDPAVRTLLEERLAVAREAPEDAARHGSLGLAYEANGLWPEIQASSVDPSCLLMETGSLIVLMRQAPGKSMLSLTRTPGVRR